MFFAASFWILALGYLTVKPSKAAGTTVRGMEDSNQETSTCKVLETDRIACSTSELEEEMCITLGCCWDNSKVNGTHCFKRTVSLSYFKKEDLEQKFCSSENLLIADINGDGFSDLVCRSMDNLDVLYGAILNTYTDWESAILDVNISSDAELLTGDVNGDSMDDLVSVDNLGTMQIIASNERSISDSSSAWTNHYFKFCPNKTARKLFLSDFNGDRLADLLCIPNSGPRQLALGQISGMFLIPEIDPNMPKFCEGDSSEVHVGDLDSDGRTDLVCRVNQGEKYIIALSDGDGFLVNEDFIVDETWCSDDGASFFIADINGDNHDDWVCHNANGKVCSKYNSYIFSDSKMFQKETCDEIKFCQNGELHLGEFNNDQRDDLFCLSAGNVTVATSNVREHIKTNFLHIDWDNAGEENLFCAHHELYPLYLGTDKKLDALCHNSRTGILEIVYGDSYGKLLLNRKWSSETLDPPFRFCYKDYSHNQYPRLMIADYNAGMMDVHGEKMIVAKFNNFKGDGQSDLLCHYQLSGKVQVVEANSDGLFTELNSKWLTKNQPFCEITEQQQEGKVFPLQFGEQLRYLACQSLDPLIWDITRPGPIAVEDYWPCPGSYRQKVYIGNFNDGYDTDILCFDALQGKIMILDPLSNVDITTDNVECDREDSQMLLTGDFNGDSFSDLLCHNDKTGEMYIYINIRGRSSEAELFQDGYKTILKFCYEIGSELQVFDVNADGLDDLICHSANGRIQIAECHTMDQIQGPCPPGYEPHNDKCYGFGLDEVTYGEAEKQCRTLGINGHLAAFHSKEELKFLIKLVRKSRLSAVHIGMNSTEMGNGSVLFRFEDGSTLDSSKYYTRFRESPCWSLTPGYRLITWKTSYYYACSYESNNGDCVSSGFVEDGLCLWLGGNGQVTSAQNKCNARNGDVGIFRTYSQMDLLDDFVTDREDIISTGVFHHDSRWSFLHMTDATLDESVLDYLPVDIPSPSDQKFISFVMPFEPGAAAECSSQQPYICMSDKQ